jgi:hypothetical protein
MGASLRRLLAALPGGKSLSFWPGATSQTIIASVGIPAPFGCYARPDLARWFGSSFLIARWITRSHSIWRRFIADRGASRSRAVLAYHQRDDRGLPSSVFLALRPVQRPRPVQNSGCFRRLRHSTLTRKTGVGAPKSTSTRPQPAPCETKSDPFAATGRAARYQRCSLIDREPVPQCAARSIDCWIISRASARLPQPIIFVHFPGSRSL